MHLRKEGSCLRKEFCFILFCKNGQKYNRYAWFFPKWTGSSVRRNLFKRWAREIFRKKQWSVGLDILVGFEKKRNKPFYETVTYEKFCANFEELCQTINV